MTFCTFEKTVIFFKVKKKVKINKSSLYIEKNIFLLKKFRRRERSSELELLCNLYLNICYVTSKTL